jgi:hypothetical protein
VRKSGLLAGVLVLVVALGSGCVASKETREAADELREELGTPSWASSVDVDTGLDGQLGDYVRVTVELDDAEPADIADFVVALPALAEDAELGAAVSLELRFVSANGSTLDVGWTGEVVAEEVARGVEEWLSISAELGPTAKALLQSDGGASYRVDLGAAAADAISVAHRLLVASAEPDTSATLAATVGDLSLELAASGPLKLEQLDTWATFLDALDPLPADLPASRVSLHLLERTVASVTVLAPDDTTEETFTIAAYGDRIWPMAHPQLRVLANLPEAWSYFVSWAPTSTPTSEHLFISLLSDQEPIDNGDETTRWSQAAKEYVSAL